MSSEMGETKIRQRVEALGNKVNTLTYRCLRPETEQDRADAFEGLVGCCFIACGWKGKGVGAGEGIIYALPVPENTPWICTFEQYRYGQGYLEFRRQATKDFIETDLKTQLDGWRWFGPKVIDALAVAGAFKWTARKVRNSLVDEIRWFYRQAAKIKRDPPPKYDWTVDRASKRMLLRVLQTRFEAAIGKAGWVLLGLLIGAFPLGRTRREWKGGATKLIAELRQVSPRQARTVKQTILEAVNGELVEKITKEILLGPENFRFEGSFCE